MKLLVGLGNPGPEHAANRHNVGFMALDRIAADHGCLPWRARFRGLLAEGRIGGERAALLKPLTYMNLSGQSVGEAMRYLRLEPRDVIVFHDELDLAPGRFRVKEGGGHAGHNGLRSLHEHLGPDYVRIRIGIGHPGARERVTGWVLGNLAREDSAWLGPLLEAISAAAPLLARGELEGFQAEVSRRLAPPRPPKPPRPPRPAPEEPGAA